MAELIKFEVAKKEVTDWLSNCGISEKQLKTLENFVDKLSEFVSKGYLVINADLSITQHLINPLGDGNTKTITYKPDYEVGTLQTNQSLNKDGSNIGEAIAMLCTLSEMPITVFQRMKRRDFTVADKVAIFFY